MLAARIRVTSLVDATQVSDVAHGHFVYHFKILISTLFSLVELVRGFVFYDILFTSSFLVICKN